MTDARDPDGITATVSRAALEAWRHAASEARAYATNLAGWCDTELSRADVTGSDALERRVLGLLSQSLHLLRHVLDRAIAVPPIDDGNWSKEVNTPLGNILNGSIGVLNFLRGGHVLLDEPALRIPNGLEGVRTITTWLKQGGLVPWTWPDVDDDRSQNERLGAWHAAQDLEQEYRDAVETEASRRQDREAESRAASIARLEQEVRASAGVVAEGATAQAFADYADKQATAARRWLIATGGLLAGVVGVGLWLLWGDSTQDWQHLVAHVVVGAPLAGLAAYSARESSRRRESAERGRHVATQLTTVNAYCAQLSEDASRDLLSHFGRYLYGPYTLPGDNPLHSVPPEVLDAVVSAIKK